MDEAQKTMSELMAVLHKMPGVSVDSTDIRDGHISIVLSIELIKSIGPIVYAANGANLPLDIWTNAPREPLHERANPAHLRYIITAKSPGANPHAALETIQLFGVFLVWYLNGIGSIAGTEANRLLTMWNGKRVTT